MKTSQKSLIELEQYLYGILIFPVFNWHSWRIYRSSTFLINWSYLPSHTILRHSLNSLTCITLRADLVAVKHSTSAGLLNDVLSHGRQGHRTAFSSFLHLSISWQKSCKAPPYQ